MYKVMLVDDEPFIIEGLYDAVDWPGFGLEVAGSAENGKEALELLGRIPVDFLITDITMPLMNGLELIRAARAIRPDLKVIILSGYNEFDYLKEGMKLGIENYLLKPINVKELGDTLRTAVEKLDSLKSDAWMNEYGVQIMRDNTLYRWVNGRITDAEFGERASMLGLSLEAALGVAAVIRPDPLQPLEDDAFALVAETLAGNKHVIPFRDMGGDIVVIAGLPSPEEDKMKLLAALSGLRKRKASLAAARLSMGRVYPLRSQISLSYQEARKAQEYFMIYPEWEWMDYGEAVSFQQAEQADFPIEWAEYAKLLVARDKEGLWNQISEDFEQLRRREGMSPVYLRGIAAELIVRFKMELEAVKHKEEPELFAIGFEQVRGAANYAELSETVRQVAGRCVESLSRDARSPVVLQVLSEIHEHYADELSLKALGARYHIHPVYLGQLFQKETGDNFTEYINRYRIEKAKELLKNSPLKVHEIARKIGYWETGYFYKQFKKYVGISPTEFKAL